MERNKKHQQPKKVGPTEEPDNDLGFVHAFIASISVIVVSELGDKTFFIAAIMAMRHSRLVVFSGAILALIVMTILSGIRNFVDFFWVRIGTKKNVFLVLFGWVTVLIPRVYTYWISTALFAIFGLKMLKDGYYMSPDEGQEEFEEVQSDLKKRDDEVSAALSTRVSAYPSHCIIT